MGRSSSASMMLLYSSSNISLGRNQIELCLVCFADSCFHLLIVDIGYISHLRIKRNMSCILVVFVKKTLFTTQDWSPLTWYADYLCKWCILKFDRLFAKFHLNVVCFLMISIQFTFWWKPNIRKIDIPTYLHFCIGYIFSIIVWLFCFSSFVY